MQPTEPKGYHTPRPLSRQLMMLLAVAFFVAGVIIAALLHYWDKIRPVSDAPVSTVQEDAAPEGKIICEDDWQAYEREAVKLGFCFPKAWGEATLADAKIAPEDDGKRWIISFHKKPEVTVGLVSADWKTDVGRGGACPDPTQQVPEYEKFSQEWRTEGGGEAVIGVSRGLEVRPDLYVIDETASEFFNGVCLRGVTEIRSLDYPVITAAYYKQFGSGVVNPAMHMENPVILVPVQDRAEFVKLVQSIRAL